MTTCQEPVSPRTGQMISTSHPCGKRADESGLCAGHRRAVQEREAQARARRAPATAEQLAEYHHAVAMVGSFADKLVVQTIGLGIGPDGLPHVRGGELLDMTERLKKTFRRLVDAELEARWVVHLRDAVMERWAATLAAEQGKETANVEA